MRPFPDNPRRLLIRSTNWIGDAVMTTPAVRTIRKNFPRAEITLLALPWVSDVFAAGPRVDRLLFYEKNGRHRGMSGRLRLIGELRREKFDAAILLQNAFEAALVTTLAGIPVRGGYTTDGRRLLLTHPVRRDPSVHTRHQVHYYQEMLAGLGLTPGDDRLELFLDKEARAKVREELERIRGGKNMPVVGLNPGAAYGPAKRWPAEKYAQLAGLLCRNREVLVLVFGTEADREAAGVIRRGAGSGQVIDLTGRTTLAEAMAWIGTCDGFVTNDSGLMHVAAALDTPTVAVFGSTNHITTGPWSKRAEVVRVPMDCSPCMKTHCPRGHFQCMEQIAPAEVFDRLQSLLATR